MDKEIAYERLDETLIGQDVKLSVSVLKTVDSTNTEIRRRILAGEAAPLAVFAERQTDGRGRMGRSFYSPEGTGIYLSLGFSARWGDPVSLTTAAAVAVHQAIAKETGIVCSIKWVNDLYHQGRKVAGILAESMQCAAERWVILGVGVNLYTTEFPAELTGIAGNLAGAADGLRNRLARALLSELSCLLTDFQPKGYMEIYRAHSMVLGRSIRYTENGVSRTGSVVSIDERGRLTVRHEDGSERLLASGEISLRFDEKERES